MKTQRIFIVGDQWLYYKIYCGVKTADSILAITIKPLVQELLDNNLIEKWFFIRYNDPEPHIRIRFKVIDVKKVGNVINAIKKELDVYIQNDIIWNVTLDTYKRELERYGSNTIEEAESIFSFDSEAVINAINLFNNDEERFLFGLKTIDDVLSLFITNDKEKQFFLEKMQRNFKKEFNIERFTKKQLDKKFRELRSTITNLLGSNKERYIEFFKILDERKNKFQPVIMNIKKRESIGNLEVPINNLLASYIHMSINRNFTSKQRLYEMMIYDFLYRYYRSINGRKNA